MCATVCQVEGAFLQGVGWVLSEEVLEDPTSGACLTPSTWSYKPPGIAELPAVSLRLSNPPACLA